MTAPLAITGLAEIVDRYDVFLVDQFGVLRDGRGPYPGAAETLSRLKAAGKTVAILSNSGKRAAENDRRLARLGFDPASWDLFLTSGEVAYRMLEGEGANGPRRCFLIARDGDTSPLDGLPVTRVDDPAAADVVLIAASEGDRFPLSHYEALLAPAARAGIPALCTNPDRIMLTAEGTAYGAGEIAALYERLGGPVTFIGKPFPAIYAMARRLAPGVPAARFCCVGDSVEHDIAGARAAGMGSVLVATGILAAADAATRAALYAEHDATPDYLVSAFIWSKEG